MPARPENRHQGVTGDSSEVVPGEPSMRLGGVDPSSRGPSDSAPGVTLPDSVFASPAPASTPAELLAIPGTFDKRDAGIRPSTIEPDLGRFDRSPPRAVQMASADDLAHFDAVADAADLSRFERVPLQPITGEHAAPGWDVVRDGLTSFHDEALPQINFVLDMGAVALTPYGAGVAVEIGKVFLNAAAGAADGYAKGGVGRAAFESGEDALLSAPLVPEWFGEGLGYAKPFLDAAAQALADWVANHGTAPKPTFQQNENTNALGK